MYRTQKGEHLHVQYIVPVPYMRSGALQKRSHQPLSSPVLYRSLEPLEAIENKGKMKRLTYRLSPDKSWGVFVQWQYDDQSVTVTLSPS